MLACGASMCSCFFFSAGPDSYFASCFNPFVLLCHVLLASWHTLCRNSLIFSSQYLWLTIHNRRLNLPAPVEPLLSTASPRHVFQGAGLWESRSLQDSSLTGQSDCNARGHRATADESAQSPPVASNGRSCNILQPHPTPVNLLSETPKYSSSEVLSTEQSSPTRGESHLTTEASQADGGSRADVDAGEHLCEPALSLMGTAIAGELEHRYCSGAVSVCLVPRPAAVSARASTCSSTSLQHTGPRAAPASAPAYVR